MSSSKSVLGSVWANNTKHKSRKSLYIALGLMIVAGLSTVGISKSLHTDVRAQAVSNFIISMDETVKVNDTLSVTISAYSDGVIDSTYTGTITFSSPDDPQASLPQDYTFTSEDAGEHTFDLAIKFSEVGIKTLEVEDIVDPSFTGENTITVEPASGSTGGGAPVIIEPANGSTINQTSVSIRGTATKSASVEISDNGESLGVTQATIDGTFVFEATNLAPSTSHTFVASAESVDSNQVTVVVKTGNLLPPDLILSQETVSVSPGDQAPRIDAAVMGEKGLKSVKIQIDKRSVELTEDVSSAGTYTGNFLSPTTPGSYPIDVLIEDALGTPQSYSSMKTLVVTSGSPTIIPPTASPIPTENTPPTVKFTFTPTTGDVPLTVTFASEAFDKEDGAPISHFWDFGDGKTSTEKNPVHVYEVSGPYTPTLTVADSAGAETTAQASSNITVASGPVLIAGLLALSGLISYLIRRKRPGEAN